MGRSPSGVATGVSGDAHLQSGAHPTGQVPFTGARHAGPLSMGPCTSQQSSPLSQQSFPQHCPEPPHVAPHGGATQSPPPQYVPGSHAFPHRPQFNGSFCRFAQRPSQQSRAVPHAGLHDVPPPLPVAPPVAAAPPVPAPPVAEEPPLVAPPAATPPAAVPPVASPPPLAAPPAPDGLPPVSLPPSERRGALVSAPHAKRRKPTKPA